MKDKQDETDMVKEEDATLDTTHRGLNRVIQTVIYHPVESYFPGPVALDDGIGLVHIKGFSNIWWRPSPLRVFIF